MNSADLLRRTISGIVQTTFQTLCNSLGVAITIPTTLINLWINMWINQNIKASDYVFTKLTKCFQAENFFNPDCLAPGYKIKPVIMNVRRERKVLF